MKRFPNTGVKNIISVGKPSVLKKRDPGLLVFSYGDVKTKVFYIGVLCKTYWDPGSAR